MRRKSLAMLFVTMMILPTALLLVPTAAATVVGCDVYPKSGPVFTPVTVTGELDPAASGRLIEIYWSLAPIPEDTPITDTESVTGGVFTAEFNVPASAAGVYYVIALDTVDGGYCFDTFEVTPKVELRCDCGCPCVCVEPCDDVYVVGTGFGSDVDVEWQAWGSGPVLASGVAHTDDTGSWYTDFHVPDVPKGVYTFEACDQNCNEAETTFLVGPVLLLDPHDGQPCDYIEVMGCLPGVEIGTTVEIYFEIPPAVQCGPEDSGCCMPERVRVDDGSIETTRCGYFEGMIHVPELPTLGPHEYTVTAEADSVSAESWFRIHACIKIDEPTEVQVGDTVTIYGHGYAQVATVTVWMSGLLPEDVPVEAIVGLCNLVDMVSAWDHENTWHILTVGLFLPVAVATTDCEGYFEAEFEVPECWGGYHLIVGTCESEIGHPCWVANIEHGSWSICYDCLVGSYLCMDECAKVVNKPILRVLPKIWTDPDSGVSGQTITLYGQGLSSFEFYVRYTDINFNQCPDLCEFGVGETYVYSRSSGFVLDFGPNERWIDGPYFPYMFLDYATGHFILNGQYDDSWARDAWGMIPYGSYSPLMLNPRGTLVSEGMSFEIDLAVDLLPGVGVASTFAFAWDYRQVGCPFLTVPWLQPQCCELVAYRFDYIEIEFHAQWPGTDIVDASLEFFTYDYDETATTCFEIEPLQVDAGVDFGEVLSRLDELEANIAGLIADAEGNVLAEIETAEGNIVAELSALDAKIVGLITDAEGNILAEIETSVGNIEAALSDLNATIVAINGDMATIGTAIGEIDVALDALNTYVTVDLAANLVTIETALGTLAADLSALDTKIVAISGDIATIGTAIGEIDVALDALNTYITVDLAAKLATIETALGTLEGKLTTMDGKMATIETDVGTITDKADLIVNHTGSMPVTIALSLIAAISAIAAAVLILRKVYIA